MTETQIVCGSDFETVHLPEDAVVVSPGVSMPLPVAEDLDATVRRAIDRPLDTPPLKAQVKRGDRVTIAFDDATVPCYAPMWGTALPIVVAELESAGVRLDDIWLVCANSLHRQMTHEELAKLIGTEFVARHAPRLRCHDAEDTDALRHLGTTPSGYDVEISKAVTESDLTIYLNCSTMRAFSGGWKSICVGLSSYRSIHHHHTPDIMSVSLDRNRMHEILNEMGEVVEQALGPGRIFKLETVLANPLSVHTVFGGSVGATRAAVLETLRAHQPNRRDLVEERVDTIVYGVPDWSPYAAYSHNNPILDLISTGLGYLGGVIEAVGKPGCTVVMATRCPDRWDEVHHASYREVWEKVLPETKDPDEARHAYEPAFAARSDYIDLYRHHNSFHPVHGIMALYPLKRLRHAGRVIVAGAEDPAIPAHVGFEAAPSVDAALSEAGSGTVALVEYPPAFNRSQYRVGTVVIPAKMADVEEIEVVVAHNERVTLRVGDVFLKIDADQTRTDIEVEAMTMAPIPTPEILWRKPPVVALAALPGTALGHLGEPSSASPAAWAAAGAAARTLHDAPLPPWPGRSLDDLTSHLVAECEWLVANDVLPADVVTRNHRLAETALRPWKPVFIHGDLQVDHVFVAGDEVTGVVDWSDASQGDALFDLAILTLGHEEHLDDVIAGYGTDVDRDLIRAWWSLRCLIAVRWLVEHGYGPPEEMPEVAVLRSRS